MGLVTFRVTFRGLVGKRFSSTSASRRHTVDLAEAMVKEGGFERAGQVLARDGFAFDAKTWKSQFTPQVLDKVIGLRCAEPQPDASSAFRLLALLRRAALPDERLVGQPHVLLQRMHKEASLRNTVDTNAATSDVADIVEALDGSISTHDKSVLPVPASFSALVKILMKAGLKKEASLAARWSKQSDATANAPATLNFKDIGMKMSALASETLEEAEKTAKADAVAETKPRQRKKMLHEDENEAEELIAENEGNWDDDETRTLLIACKHLVSTGRHHLVMEINNLEEHGTSVFDLVANTSPEDIKQVDEYMVLKKAGKVQECSTFLTNMFMPQPTEQR